MEECIFCKIVSGEIETFLIYEDATTMAFLDINPCTKGHAVVIPRKHFVFLADMPESLVRDLWATATKVAVAVQAAMGAEGFNLGVNSGGAAGQALPHVHLHILPRYKNDHGGSMHTIVRQEVDREELPKYLEKIRMALKTTGLAKEEKKEEEKRLPPKTKNKWLFLD